MIIKCELWSINRILRWTGWRLFVQIDKTGVAPTLIGFIWYGWKDWAKETVLELFK